MRRIGFVLALAAIGFWPTRALAQCLSGGVVNICENPLDGKSPEAIVDGGTFLSSGGFRIDEKGNHVSFDLGGARSSGTVRFSISNVSLANLNQDTHLILLITDTPSLNPLPKYLLELKIWGTKVDPDSGGITRIGVSDGVEETTKSAGKLVWNASTTYQMDVSWDEATQTVKLVRNGQTLASFKTGDLIPGTNNPPIAMPYRYVHLAMPYMSNPMFWPVMKSVYKMAAISADGEPTSSGGAGGTGGFGGEAGSAGAPQSGGAAGAPDLTPPGGSSNNLGGQSFGGANTGGYTSTTGGSTSTPGKSVDAEGSTTEDSSGCNASHRESNGASLAWMVIAIALGALRRRGAQ